VELFIFDFIALFAVMPYLHSEEPVF